MHLGTKANALVWRPDETMVRTDRGGGPMLLLREPCNVMGFLYLVSVRGGGENFI